MYRIFNTTKYKFPRVMAGSDRFVGTWARAGPSQCVIFGKEWGAQ